MSGDKRRPTTRRQRPIARPQLPAGPLRDLKDLLYKLHLDAGTPTMDELAAAAADDDSLPGAPGKDTVHRILVSPEVPPSQADVVAVVVALARMAAWDPDDARSRARDLWVEARMSMPLGQPISDCDPIALEIHRPIDALPVDADAELPPLPAYVLRAHDHKLREVVDRAAAGASGIAILVGGSSTGKTRACWEAVQQLPAGWRLWHPINPSHPQAILDQLDALGPRTVVWLNETQLYLDTPDEAGEQVAAHLRDAIRNPDLAPLLVLGTLWPNHWDALTTGPPSSSSPRVRAHSRALLSGAAIRVPANFDEAAQQSLKVAAVSDSRLRQALRQADQGRIAQYLAGGPALVERYETAPAAARALVEAAMDARRMGHGTDIPLPFLKRAAWDYLGEFEQDQLGDDWLETALAYNSTTVHGVRGLLTPCRQASQGSESTVAGRLTYRLADYLEHHGWLERRFLMPPEGFWKTAAEHIHLSDDLMNLANAAHIRWRKKLAADLYGRIADTQPKAFAKLISLLIEAGQDGTVDCLARTAIDGLDSSSLTQIAVIYAEKGDRAKAERFTLQAQGVGGTDVMGMVHSVLARRKEGGLSFQIPGDEGPRSRSFTQAPAVPEGEPNWHERRVWCFPASSGKAPWVKAEVAGRKQEAEFLAKEAAKAGATWAWLDVAAVREEAGESAEEVDRLIRLAVDAGDLQALEWLAGRRAAAGDTMEANRLAIRAVNGGNPAAAIRLTTDQEHPRDAQLQLMKFGLTIDGSLSGAW